MIKIVDIDGLFEEYISSFVKENIGKIKPEEIENEIPVLYEKFGKETLKECLHIHLLKIWVYWQ